MAIGTDFEIQNDKDIRYIGAAHGSSSAGYYTVIEFHRWLQDLADNAAVTGNDYLDITRETPSERSTDNIITLINSYNIDDTAAEHLYDGSIIQSNGDVIYDGLLVLATVGMDLQVVQNGAVVSNDFWNYSVAGTHDGSANAATLSDSTASFVTNAYVGYWLVNVTDGSRGIITANTSTTVTATLAGGTDNDWDAGDVYKIVLGLNSDSANGISHRFMLKVRTGGSDIDGRRLIGQTREWGKTYSEFRINGTSRGNNVLALTYADDLNNQTAIGTVSGWSDITNVTSGYNLIDVDNNAVNEAYYSKWDRGSRTINQFYERMKWISRRGSSTTFYGLNGALFRGITHEVALSGSSSGTFSAYEAISWGSGGTAGTGQMLAIDNTTASSATKMWIQLLTGVAPSGTVTITGGTSSATATNSGTPIERTLSRPFCGASTGSAIIGAYGFALESADLSASDLLFDLTNTPRTPPNVVTFTVSGLLTGGSGDRILVGPADAGNLKLDQMTLNGALTGAAVTSVVVTGSIPSDTPTTGTIRIERDDGQYSIHPYSAFSGSTFTITSHNFSTNNASNGNNVFISYIDKQATSASETFSVVYASDRDLFVRVRNGDAGAPIKTFQTTGTLGSAGGSATVIRTSDA